MTSSIDPPLSDNQQFDLIIVGSGGGSVVAALAAKARGLSPVVLEKLNVVGGTTSYSGGVAWIPNNPLMAREGVTDSIERAQTYLDNAVFYRGPATSQARRDAFLEQGPEMVTFLEDRGMKFERPSFYPDYHSDLPGAEQGSRSIAAPVFDLNELGSWKSHFAGTGRPPLPCSVDEAFRMSLFKRSWPSRWLALKIALRMLAGKIRGQDLRGMGVALQGRLLQLALNENIPIVRNCSVEKLLTENGMVTGVSANRKGSAIEFHASRGVLLNAGGYAKNAELRQACGPLPSYPQFSKASPGDTGEVMQMAIELGAATDCLDEALWGMASMEENGNFPGGSVGPEGNPPPGHHFDISLPHCIMVDQNGRRFANEADSYMTVGQALYARHRESGGRGIPAYAIIDSRHRQRYPWGMTLGKVPKSWLDSGYMKVSESLEELARQCGIEPEGFVQEVSKFNEFCRSGRDEDFGRGAKAFDNSHGDHTVSPNPNLGSIEKPPFYTVAIYPGDVSTWGGLVTDEHARVLDKTGAVIKGLYATGTTAASVFGRTYPGAGASIGPAMVFGYIAAKAMADSKS